ncbi:hypothetical protein FACS18945_4430 [Bacteroidia bacterium]|nr:hypothetical protein FACS18945_4430 [Bacteroidia bacterium]
MTLNAEDRETLVTLRIQKAKETLEEVKGNARMGYWRTTANRLYYACYYAASALLIKNGLLTHTHSGVISQLGLHFISKGIIGMEQGKLYKHLFELRQTGDYDDWITVEEKDVVPQIAPAENFIKKIEELITNK